MVSTKKDMKNLPTSWIHLCKSTKRSGSADHIMYTKKTYSYKNDCDLWLLCIAIFWHAKEGQSFSASYYHSFHGNTDGEYCIRQHHLLWSPTQKEALPLFHLWLMHIYGFKRKKERKAERMSVAGHMAGHLCLLYCICNWAVGLLHC